ncbi:MAG: M28 family peptidase, partial [Phormidesmis sp.]
MRKSGGFFFAIAAIAMAIVIWGNPITQLVAAFSPAAPTATASHLALSTADLSVDLDRLMAHVQALAKPRATQPQRETARRYIIEQLSANGIASEQQRYGLATEKSAGVDSGVNIVADILGSDPTAGSIVLGAHYDTEIGSPGADDNGSAIAALLEAARIFSSQSATLQAKGALPAPRGLKLVFFDQEERQIDGSGLLGSIAFTEKLDNLTGVKGAIVLDMIGYACHTQGCQAYPPRLPIVNLPETGNFLVVLGLQNHIDVLGAFTLSAQTTLPTVLSLPVPQPMLNLCPDLL